MIDTPCHRASDPITSMLADKHITQSGIRQRQVRLAEYAVKQHSGYTARELAAITDLDHEMLHKRLPESKKLRKGGKVRCMITGYAACQWVVDA